MPKYWVIVAMNGPENVEWRRAAYSTCAGAVAACRYLIDDWLAAHYEPGVFADEAMERWLADGPNPHVLVAHDEAQGMFRDSACSFNASKYASARCALLWRTSQRQKRSGR